MKIKEEWGDVVGYEGLYLVSDLGRIKSLDRRVGSKGRKPHLRKGRFLNIKPYSSGYIMVTLCNGVYQKSTPTHRVVCEAFYLNPELKPFVNHKNGIKSDNRSSNLEWCTAKENNAHALATGLRVPAKGSKAGGSILIESQVLDICKLLDTTYLTNQQIADMYGVDGPAIANIHVGRKWNWLTNRKGKSELYKNLQGERHHMSRAVINCRGEIFKTGVEASIRYKISRGSLSKTCRGSRHHCGKYEDGTPIKWQYAL